MDWYKVGFLAFMTAMNMFVHVFSHYASYAETDYVRCRIIFHKGRYRKYRRDECRNHFRHIWLNLRARRIIFLCDSCHDKFLRRDDFPWFLGYKPLEDGDLAEELRTTQTKEEFDTVLAKREIEEVLNS